MIHGAPLQRCRAGKTPSLIMRRIVEWHGRKARVARRKSSPSLARAVGERLVGHLSMPFVFSGLRSDIAVDVHPIPKINRFAGTVQVGFGHSLPVAHVSTHRRRSLGWAKARAIASTDAYKLELLRASVQAQPLRYGKKVGPARLRPIIGGGPNASRGEALADKVRRM